MFRMIGVAEPCVEVGHLSTKMMSGTIGKTRNNWNSFSRGTLKMRNDPLDLGWTLKIY